ncbi:MAG: SGNH/GDSL hydrolase family protein [Chitinophagales bacterium]
MPKIGKLRDNLLLSVFSVTAALLIAEVVLRWIGYRPGVMVGPDEMKQYWYVMNDTQATEFPIFCPDSFGIFKANPTCYPGPPQYKELYQAVTHTRYNSQGFRGREFAVDSAYRVMLLGDSYTFGFDATPFDSSFADVLEDLNPDIAVYNGGVPGADLATYEAVARHYAATIRPHLIVVCINRADFLQYPKELKPYCNSDIYVTTNSILFTTDFNYSKDSIRVFPDLFAAQDALMRKVRVGYTSSNRFTWLAGHSVVMTWLYKWSGMSTDSNFDHRQIWPKGTYSPVYIERLKGIAKSSGAELIFTVIPGPQPFTKGDEMQLIRKITGDDVSVYYPHGISLEEHYGKHPRMHFNNNGHRYYAKFLNQVISRYRDAAKR